ncbi:MAG TPA: DNA recombination protein RmuC [Burkholderiales bacterium]|nr:DNA recombination protein RmuC [Burkholderiales bacterium]
MLEWLYIALALIVAAGFVVLFVRVNSLARVVRELPLAQAETLEQKHRAMLADLHEGLARQGERLGVALTESSERLRAVVGQELSHTRDAVQVLRLSQQHDLGTYREAMLEKLSQLTLALQEKLAEQGNADRELIRTALKDMTRDLGVSFDALSRRVDERLEQSSAKLATSIEGLTTKTDERLGEISGKVNERLEEGFKKTNETFTNVMARLATIDEAQRKIDGLTSNVVSLQELLGDKRSRGAFGEVQLEGLVRNILPPNAYALQYTLSNGNRADCVLKLPEPTGMVAVDSKFPLENYHRMFESGAGEAERAQAQRQFKADVRRHVDDIGAKYIVAGETSDGAVMFVPAEAVFAEIHAYHADVVEHAMMKHVWVVSPTTLMAVLNTARAVLKDVETRRQVHVIRDALAKLGKDFARFDERMRKLADHIRQAHEDAEKVHTSSVKITQRFLQIEAVELEHDSPPALPEESPQLPLEEAQAPVDRSGNGESAQPQVAAER